MMSVRTSAFHYKKRTPAQVKTKKRHSSVGVSPSASQATIVSATSSQASLSPSSGNSLMVPGMRKRSGSVPALKLNTLATLWNLKYEQVRAMRMTWARLCEPPRSNCRGIVNVVERVWEKIDTKDPSVRNIFYNAAFVDSMQERCERRRSKGGSIATLRDHTHFFVSLVSQVVQSLDVEPHDILEHIDKIGRNHAYLKQYGFKSSHWEKVGEYFIDIVVIQDCVRGMPDACRAWTILVAAIVDRLRAAPRRGSVAACNLAGSQNNLYGSTNSVNVGLRRGSCASSAANGSQSSLGSQNNYGCPMRIPGHHASTSDLMCRDDYNNTRDLPITPSALPVATKSCIDLAPLGRALPEIRSGNPAVA